MSMRRVQSPHVKEPRPRTWSNCRALATPALTVEVTRRASSAPAGRSRAYPATPSIWSA